MLLKTCFFTVFLMALPLEFLFSEKLLLSHKTNKGCTDVHNAHLDLWYAPATLNMTASRRVRWAGMGNVRKKFTLEQAMKAQRWSTGIAPFFFNLDTRWGVAGQRHAPALFPPGKRSGIHCIEARVARRTVLDGCGKSRFHRDSIPGTCRPWRVAILTAKCEIHIPNITWIF